MKNKPTGVIITAIVCITVLEIVAIIKGIDGKLFALACGAICALGGVSVPFIFKKLKL